MAREEMVSKYMDLLVIAEDKDIAPLVWPESPAHSGRVQAAKALKNLTDLGKLEKGDGFWRLPGCKSEYKEHAQLLTKSLTDILKLPVNPTIYREKKIEEVSLIPDALLFIEKSGKGIVAVFEQVHNETDDYLRMKIRTWREWSNALDYLGKLFGYAIPQFYIVVSGTVMDGTIPFNQFLEAIK